MQKRISKFFQKKNKTAETKVHRSFRRSYREDYKRDLELPGLLAHSFQTWGQIFKNWRIFGLLVLAMLGANILLVGLMSEETYRGFHESVDKFSQSVNGFEMGNFAKAGLLLISTMTTGGVNQAPSEAQQIFGAFLFLVIWLTTIYIMRHIMAEKTIKLRDALYNAMAPFISTTIVSLVIFLQAIPLFITLIAYAAAQNTDFLSTPFYAMVFFLLASCLVLLSLYLMSGTILALVAVSSPGMYPLTSIRAVGEIIMGRRTKVMIRVAFLAFILGITWVVVGLPIILLDIWLKSSFEWMTGIPIVPIVLLVMMLVSFVYIAVYFYTLYRNILQYDEKK